MYILGINAFYHDAAAALLHDGKIIAMAEEERFSRDKHACGAFPHAAIEFCLKQAGVTFDDVSHLTFMHDIEAILANDPTIEPFKQFFKSNPDTFREFNNTFSVQLDYVRSYCAEKKLRLEILNHHDCHLSSAFFGSTFEEANIISIDGRGDTETAVLAHGKGGSIKKLLSIPMPHSLGLLYTAVTNLLGFRPFDGEGKVMGLAPYGQNRFSDFFSEVIYPTDQGFATVPDYYYPLTGGFLSGSCRLEEVFGKKRTPMMNSVNGLDEDIACSLQCRTEEIMAHLAEMLYRMTGCRNLCLAGGVALNAKMSGKLRREGFIDNIYIQPIANDAGCAIGGPMHLYNALTGQRPASIDHLYLGPEFSNDEIRQLLIHEGFRFGQSDDLARDCARMLADGKIVGWYQGRMEVGPRALGNRSILANPADPAMKDIVNNKVKRREAWRPFASSMLDEYKHLYLENACDAPFMILNFEVTERAVKELTSGIHIDNTTRPQTVTATSNPLYHAMISEFGRLTGVHAVLNTSFNLAGEPIVLTPRQAVHDFQTCDMDCLIMGDFYLEKSMRKRAFINGFTAEKEESALSFDQYQRYRIVADTIQSLRHKAQCRILDIGSGSVNLAEFLPYDSIIKIDKGDIQEPNLIQGDATDIPFKDGYFDFVVSCDCFEHLTPEDRDKFLAEAARVSSRHLIIACPFNMDRVAENEKTANNYFEFLNGKANHYLAEHEEAGLPDLPDLLYKVEDMDLHATVLDNGYLDNWLPLMFLEFYLENQQQWDISRIINSYYNRHCYHADNNTPCYRKVVVISKPELHSPAQPVAGHNPLQLNELAAVVRESIVDSIKSELDLLGASTSHSDQTISEIVGRITAREKVLPEFRASIESFLASGIDSDKSSVSLLRYFVESIETIPSQILQFTNEEVHRNKERAFKVITEYLRICPDNGEAWNDLGTLFLSENILDKAKQSLQNACLLEYPLAYRNLSALYLIDNDEGTAAAVANEAVRKGVDPQMFNDLGLSSRAMQ